MGFRIYRVAADGTRESILYLSYSVFAELLRVLAYNEDGMDMFAHPGRKLLFARRDQCEDAGKWTVHATRVVHDYLTRMLDARQRLVTEGTNTDEADTVVTRMRFVWPPLETQYIHPPDWDNVAEELEQGFRQAVTLGQMIDFS